MMKTGKWMMTLALLMLVLSACGNNGNTSNAANAGNAETGVAAPPAAEAETTETTTLKVASLIPPMTDILELIKPQLKEEGIDLEVVVLSDNVQPNDALANKEVDANFFQHVPWRKGIIRTKMPTLSRFNRFITPFTAHTPNVTNPWRNFRTGRRS